LKRYLPSDVGPKIMDQVIDALAVNTIVECLYIQNFEKGMHDEQLDRLTDKVLGKGNIWAVNLGENFRISHYAWNQFLLRLPDTMVSYLYVSEHHLKGTSLKDKMRDAIRENRSRLGQRDTEVIRQVNNMWWNPKSPEQLKVSRARRAEQERVRQEKLRKEKEKRKMLKAKERAKAKKSKKSLKKKKLKLNKKHKVVRRGVQLTDLVGAGLLQVGEVVSMKYKSRDVKTPVIFMASIVMREGMAENAAALHCETTGEVHSSVSGWAIKCIRTITPNRMAIDGWLSAKTSSGTLLKDVRTKYLRGDRG